MLNRLSLAGASDGAIGATSRGSAVGSLGATISLGSSSRRGDLEVAHVDQGLLASVAARTADLGFLLIGGDVEGDEQEQVGGDDTDTSESSEFLTGALAHVGGPREVSRGEVSVRSEVDKACWEQC